MVKVGTSPGAPTDSASGLLFDGYVKLSGGAVRNAPGAAVKRLPRPVVRKDALAALVEQREDLRQRGKVLRAIFLDGRRDFFDQRIK